MRKYTEDERFMKEAIRQARKAEAIGDVPIGCVIVSDGKIIARGTTEELTRQVEGKVWSGRIPENRLLEYERRLRIVNLKNEEGGQISLRYLAEAPQIEGSISVPPRMEDLYLWLFPQEKNQT